MSSKFTKSSSFFNIKVELKQPHQQAIDITDSVEKFHLVYEKSNIFPQIELHLKTNTAKIQNYHIGFFSEKYDVTLEIYDNSRENILDSISMTLKPTKYLNLDLKMVSRMMETSNPDSNSGEIEFSMLLINSFTESLFFSKSLIWERPVSYDEIFSTVIAEAPGWYEYDDPEFPELTFEQFFIPYDRLYNVIAYVVSKGYFSEFNSVCFIISHNGLRLYNLKNTKKRPIIKTAIFPNASDIKDLNGIFVVDFSIDRSPDLKLKYGTRMQTIGVGHFRGDTTIRGVNYTAKNAAFNPNMFEDIPSQQLEYHNFGLKNSVVQNSIISAFSEMNVLKLSVTKWSSFEYIMPLKHLYNLMFTSKTLSNYSGQYYIVSTDITVERVKQEFTPRITLDMRMIDDDSAEKY